MFYNNSTKFCNFKEFEKKHLYYLCHLIFSLFDFFLLFLKNFLFFVTVPSLQHLRIIIIGFFLPSKDITIRFVHKHFKSKYLSASSLSFMSRRNGKKSIFVSQIDIKNVQISNEKKNMWSN